MINSNIISEIRGMMQGLLVEDKANKWEGIVYGRITVTRADGKGTK